MNKTLLTAAIAIPFGIAVVPHLPGLHAQAVDLVVVNVTTVAKGYRTSKLAGSNVVNEKNEKIGTVDDLIIGHDEPHVLFAILQVGSFLGLGGHLVAVSFQDLKFDDASGKITLPGASKQELQRLPEFVYGGT